MAGMSALEWPSSMKNRLKVFCLGGRSGGCDCIDFGEVFLVASLLDVLKTLERYGRSRIRGVHLKKSTFSMV